MAVLDCEKCIAIIKNDTQPEFDIKHKIKLIDELLTREDVEEDDKPLLECYRDDLYHKLSKIEDNYPRISG